MTWRKRIPQILIGLTLGLGVTIIFLSLRTNRDQYDRETELAAAKYDSREILAELKSIPASALEMPEFENSPLQQALNEESEMWARWEQRFSAETSFNEIADTYGEVLLSMGWNRMPAQETGVVTFEFEDWSIDLHQISGAADSKPIEFRRELLWEKELP